MKITQQQMIVRLLKSDPSRWFKSYELLKVSTKWGFIGSQGDRRARELAENGTIEVRHVGKYAEYRYLDIAPKYEKVMVNGELRVRKVEPQLSMPLNVPQLTQTNENVT